MPKRIVYGLGGSDPNKPNNNIVEESEIAETPLSLKEQLRAVWDALPVELRASLRPLKPALNDAIEDGCIDEAILMVQAQNVPAQFAPIKAQMLQMLQEKFNEQAA